MQGETGMKDIIRLLNDNKALSGYRVVDRTTDSYELFFVHEKPETVRSTSTADSEVTVYIKHDGYLGESSFNLYESMDENAIREKIDTAASRAMLINNEPYELPKGGKLDVELPTDLDRYDRRELGRKIADAVFSCCSEGATINALEVFIYTDTRRIRNSNGLDKKEKVNRVMIEAIPTFTDDHQSVELYEDYRFTFFDEKKLKEEISEKLREVSDRVKASKPETPMDIDCVIKGHEVAMLMDELAYDLSYASVYQHMNLRSKEDLLQKEDTGADRITLTMKGIVEGSERSSHFDDDGTELKDTCIIRDGKVADYFGSNRFGQYLGIEEPSGSLPCMEMGKGTLTEKELEDDRYLELVSLSGLQVELYSDYIGGEIRLAYLHENGRVTPVTGITMSGKLNEVLDHLRFSSKTGVSGSFKGPEKMLLKNMHVL